MISGGYSGYSGGYPGWMNGGWANNAATGLAARQSYTVGGAPTLSSMSAPYGAYSPVYDRAAYTAFTDAAMAQPLPAASSTLAAHEGVATAQGAALQPVATAGVADTLGGTLGAAGVAYGAYSGISAGQKALKSYDAAAKTGELTPEQMNAMRAQTTREGYKSAAVGGISGALAGAEAGAMIGSGGGPVGAVIGGVLGAAGGLAQAYGARKRHRHREY